MGGDDSQKLLPWRGMILLSGAQQPPAQLRNQHSNAKLATGNVEVPGASRFIFYRIQFLPR